MDLTPIAPKALAPAAKPLADGAADQAADPAEERALRRTAQDFEAAFLAEMLKGTGLNALPDGFGGGAGEEAFASFLNQEYARLMAERGGIGLAEHIFETLKQKAAGT